MQLIFTANTCKKGLRFLVLPLVQSFLCFLHLFVPISSQGDPQQNGRLHACSSNHSTPNALYAKLEVKPKKGTKGNTDYVITADVHISYKLLPSTSNSHT
uniref:Uncharacterized protein n=1 Tax=Arundo donax TaxID=35708 RepID=A0A0A8YR24_ARUDO